ncbi:hypothetical protein K469DRAFT_86225 [Zopfia rhizophila CBS 207.26]|uniref:Uncharacterized protein n=1 Tax=Zopfia rhizophila CBS 207.26 TaxID=1314779 RepID=A0A6A6D7H6_9PEZI|nr:hypothetical protein K469DRAFT_86225 [Zopfia rhizophila CBS 207.26]
METEETSTAEGSQYIFAVVEDNFNHSLVTKRRAVVNYCFLLQSAYPRKVQCGITQLMKWDGPEILLARLITDIPHPMQVKLSKERPSWRVPRALTDNPGRKLDKHYCSIYILQGTPIKDDAHSTVQFAAHGGASRRLDGRSERGAHHISSARRVAEPDKVKCQLIMRKTRTGNASAISASLLSTKPPSAKRLISLQSDSSRACLRSVAASTHQLLEPDGPDNYFRMG